MEPPWEVFICHRGPDVKKEFASFLHYALDVQGIRAFFDHAMVGGTNPRANMETAMQTASWGVVILSPRFFESKWCMKELRVFLDRGNVLPVSVGMAVDDCDANKIAGKVGPVREEHGGELLWNKCEMEEAEWRGLVNRVAREAVVVKSEDSNDYWGDFINELVVNLARKLGMPVVESRVAQKTVAPPYPRNLDFLGRDAELAHLEKVLLKPQARVSISSMGGMGKTQLALEYVYKHLDVYFKLLWVDAGAETLVVNYLGLAKDLGVTLEKDKGTKPTATDQQGDKEVALVRGALERLRVPCLLVLDDIVDADAKLLRCVLPRTGQCKVIVTTRLRHLANFENIPLGQLSDLHGLTLIRGSPHLGDHEADLEALAKRFGYLTLALSVCSAWMKECEKMPSELMRDLDKEGEVVLAFGERELDPVFNTNPDLLSLFQASVEQLKKKPQGQLAEYVLKVGGWFASASIRHELLLWAASSLDGRGGKEQKIEGAVNLLVKFSLAAKGQMDGGQAAVRGVVFHPVVQSFGREKGGLNGALSMVRALMNVGDAALDTEHFQHACDLAISKEESQRVRLDGADRQAAIGGILLPLVSQYFVEGLYFKARDTVLGIDIEQMSGELQGAYLDTCASSLEYCGMYEEALPHFQRALRIKEKALGLEHTSVAATLNNMAELLRSQGKYEEAQPLYERSLHIWENALGPEDRVVASSHNNMALLLRDQGHYDKALRLFEQSMRIWEKALGPEHTLVATALNNMALVLENQGRYDKVLLLRERSLRIRVNALGPEHPELARSYNNKAELLRIQGKYKEAQPLYERSLRIRQSTLGAEHPDVAQSYNNLGLLLQDWGQYDEALRLFEQSLPIWEKALGPEHTSVATTVNNMAELLRTQGKYEEAQPLYERSLRIRQTTLGAEHPDVAQSYNNMAILLHGQAQYEEALRLFEHSLRIRENALGPEHSDVANTLSNMATVLSHQGKYDEALPRIERSLRIREKALGPEHPDVAFSYNNMALLLRDQGQYDEALRLSEHSMHIWEKALGPEHTSVATALNNMALLLENQGKYDKALPLHERSLRIREDALGSEHSDVANTLNNMAMVLKHQGKYDEALPRFERSLRIRENALGPEHPDVAITLNNLASLLESQGRHVEALPVYERALRIGEDTLGSDHPHVLIYHQNLVLARSTHTPV